MTKGWLGILTGFWIFGLFNRKPKEAESEPTQTMEAPSVTEGQNIPVLFGSRMIKSPLIAWWGDVSIVKVEAPQGGKKG